MLNSNSFGGLESRVRELNTSPPSVKKVFAKALIRELLWHDIKYRRQAGGTPALAEDGHAPVSLSAVGSSPLLEASFRSKSFRIRASTEPPTANPESNGLDEAKLPWRESDASIPAEEERRRALVYLPADATLPMPHDALGRSGESGRTTNRLGRFELLGVVGEGAYRYGLSRP